VSQRISWRKVDLSPLEGKSLLDPVFASDAGTMRDDANVRHVYGRILTAAGLRHLKFHGLRHTYAALLLGSGATLTHVRDQMGHQSIQVTADVYRRLIPAGSRSAVDALDDAVTTQSDATPRATSGRITSSRNKERVGEPRRNRTFNPQIKSLAILTNIRGIRGQLPRSVGRPLRIREIRP
jgi:hypothetical protein